MLATFGAGCFWHVEEVFGKISGVVSTSVGYSGGHVENPTYEQVCTGQTGHIESVQIEYDPAIVAYEKILDVFWANHDPTTPDRQGPDIGTQYRSAIFTHNEEQNTIAKASKDACDESAKYENPIVTRILPAGEFYKAEEYHQKYLKKNCFL